MSESATPDEQPKKKIARRVVSQKRQYFVPDHGVAVDADDVADAGKVAKKAITKKEEGDAE